MSIIKFDIETMKALKKSIAHWKRMITWAKKRKHQPADIYTMLGNLGECWCASDCSLCALYQEKSCKGCPLNDSNEYCNYSWSLWRKVTDILDDPEAIWGDWLIPAKNMLAALEEMKKTRSPLPFKDHEEKEEE